jgi:hypothetical protein
MPCLQLKQNLVNINSLKSELDLELLKIEKLFKELKDDSREGKEYKAERKDLMNKIKSLKTEINSEIEKIEKLFPAPKVEVGKEFNLRFKYRSLEEMIKAGKFDEININIDSTNFPDPQEKELLNQVIKVKAKIFDFKKHISSEDVLVELDKAGFRPATAIELLALAEIDLKSQRQFYIVSLGSSWQGFLDVCLVPYLMVGGSNRRNLDLSNRDGGWGQDCRFLAIRKENN